MSDQIPSADGQDTVYNLSNSNVGHPRILYVNGMQTDGPTHAMTAATISLLTERPVTGIFNSTRGFLRDGLQSAKDWKQNAKARAASNSLTPNQNVPDNQVEQLADDIIAKARIWNKATPKLFKILMQNIKSRQVIVAHSQGNLITSNALFVVQDALGSQALKNIRVYSLASPSPGWPLGLRHTNGGGGRQENAFMNDFVALLRPHNALKKAKDTLKSIPTLGAQAAGAVLPDIQNAGDFQTLEGGGYVGLAAHDIPANMSLNFLNSIRGEVNLPKITNTEQVQKLVDDAGDEAKKWLKKIMKS